MGQKADPRALRLGITRSWDSKWYATKKDYAKYIHQDLAIRSLLEKRYKEAAISRIEILRTGDRVIVIIHTARPGLVIGTQGEGVQTLRDELEKKFQQKFSVTVKEVPQAGMDAKLIAETIAAQIEKRISYRRACKTAIEKAMDGGAQGVKIFVAGRLNGVEIARSEFFAKGKIPLQTFRADIDYAYVPAITTYGTIGVKTWVYRGEKFKRVSALATE